MSVTWQVIPSFLLDDVPHHYVLASEVDRRLAADGGGAMNGKTLLNVGCGRYLVDDLYFSLCGAKVTSIDFEPATIDLARRKLELAEQHGVFDSTTGNVTVQSGDGRQLPFEDESFDIATAFSSLEHMTSGEDQRRALAEMHRVLKPNGWLVVTAPNLLNPLATVASVLDHWRKGEHESRFTPWRLKRFLRSANVDPLAFDSESLRVFDQRLVDTHLPWFNRLPRFAWTMAEWTVAALGKLPIPKYFGMRIGYVCIKRAAAETRE